MVAHLNDVCSKDLVTVDERITDQESNPTVNEGRIPEGVQRDETMVVEQKKEATFAIALESPLFTRMNARGHPPLRWIPEGEMY
ncbi:hypothetical protein NMY22_g3383 [Coprinellus aureogranulatus]|nr:hypothetical protein NMY22_g3383 [Coprinellus aureogranulatus]